MSNTIVIKKCNGCGINYEVIKCHTCNELDYRFCIKCHNRGNAFIHRMKEPVKEYLALSAFFVVLASMSLGVFAIGR